MKASNSILLSVSLLSAGAVSAQDISTEVLVDRTIVPVQRAARRPGILSPAMLEPKTDVRVLDMAEYSGTSDFNPSIPTLNPTAYTGLKPLSPFRGYASVGYFPAYNLGASAGYRFISNQRTSLGAMLQFDGNSYHAPLIPGADGKSTVKNNTITAGIDFSQRVGDKSRLDVGVDYTHGAHSLPDAANPDRTEHLNAADVSAAWWSSAGAVGYNVRASYSHFSYAGNRTFNTLEGVNLDLEGAREDHFKIQAGGICPLDRHRHAWVGLDLGTDILHRGSGLEQSIYTDTTDPRPVGFVLLGQPRHTTSAIITATPYFGLNYQRVNARIGLDVDISTGTSGKMLHIAPEVLLDWNPSRQIALYATFTGGESFNTLRSLYDYNPFVQGRFVYANSYSPVKSRLGINVGPFYGATVGLYGGYERVNNLPMPALVDGAVAGFATSTMLTFGPYASFVAADVSGWRAGLSLGYAWRDILKVNVGAEALPHGFNAATTDNLDRAALVVSGALTVNPLRRLSLGIDYELRCGRRYYQIARMPQGEIGHTQVRMRNISDLGFNARYSLTEAFSVFAGFENILCRQVEILPLLPSQRLHGLLGVSLKF